MPSAERQIKNSPPVKKAETDVRNLHKDIDGLRGELDNIVKERANNDRSTKKLQADLDEANAKLGKSNKATKGLEEKNSRKQKQKLKRLRKKPDMVVVKPRLKKLNEPNKKLNIFVMKLKKNEHNGLPLKRKPENSLRRLMKLAKLLKMKVFRKKDYKELIELLKMNLQN